MKKFAQEIKEATATILRIAHETADLDPIRPQYHFHAPAQWMDDPNGIIYHKGYYHMMYSLNPDSSTARAGMVYKTGSNRWTPEDPDWTGGITVWGHARSKDLIHWEHLPVALFPDRARGEYYIWFGCTAINGEGIPVAIYTSIGYENRNPTDSAVQWIAFGDDDLLEWETAEEENPIMTEELHGKKKIWEWRDPFLFSHLGKNYLILGGKQDKADGGKAVVLLYEANNKRFTKWTYRGVLFEYPDPTLRSVECPNLVRLGENWVLLLSPHGAAQYFVGNIDFDACCFTWKKRGMIDYSTNFYATNVLFDAQGRSLMWGAIEGFSGTKGWNGINSLPREIGLDGELCLTQHVPNELLALRGKGSELRGTAKKNFGSATLEIRMTVPTGANARLTLICVDEERYAITIDGTHVAVGPYTLPLNEKLAEQSLAIYIDKSVTEMFLNDREAITLTIPPCVGETSVHLLSHNAECSIWQLYTNDLFSIPKQAEENENEYHNWH